MASTHRTWQLRVVQDLHVHDPSLNDVKDQITSRRKQRHASEPGPVRSVRPLGRVEALAEVITASTLLIELDVPGGDGEILLPFSSGAFPSLEQVFGTPPSDSTIRRDF